MSTTDFKCIHFYNSYVKANSGERYLGNGYLAIDPEDRQALVLHWHGNVTVLIETADYMSLATACIDHSIQQLVPDATEIKIAIGGFDAELKFDFCS